MGVVGLGSDPIRFSSRWIGASIKGITMQAIAFSPRQSRLFSSLSLAVALFGATALTGCYVTPIQQQPTTIYIPAPAMPAMPASMTFAARLYPANDAASAFGMVNAIVTNDLNGRGTFSTNINGENFTGEATRTSSASSRQGVANGVGNRGSFINCNYQMNSATLGLGQCRLNNGALFTMHVGS